MQIILIIYILCIPRHVRRSPSVVNSLCLMLLHKHSGLRSVSDYILTFCASFIWFRSHVSSQLAFQSPIVDHVSDLILSRLVWTTYFQSSPVQFRGVLPNRTLYRDFKHGPLTDNCRLAAHPNFDQLCATIHILIKPVLPFRFWSNVCHHSGSGQTSANIQILVKSVLLFKS